MESMDENDRQETDSTSEKIDEKEAFEYEEMVSLYDESMRHLSEGQIVTAGGIDAHIHFICPQQIEEALMSGVTTMLGGGTGPATGSNATTCTPGPWHIGKMLQAADAFPMNLSFAGKGNAALPGPTQFVIDMSEWFLANWYFVIGGDGVTLKDPAVLRRRVCREASDEERGNPPGHHQNYALHVLHLAVHDIEVSERNQDAGQNQSDQGPQA